MELTISRFFFLVIASMAFLSSVGCCSTPEMKKFDVNVALDDSLKVKGEMPAIEVNIIGVDATLLKRWMNKPVDEYWAQAEGLRSSRDKLVMTFGPEDHSKTLSRADPLWATWKKQGAMDLVIIAFIPGMSSTGEGEIDPRRLSLTLNSCRWQKSDTINLVVQSSGIISLSQPAPLDK